MEFKDKIQVIEKKYGVDKTALAVRLQLNYIVFIRNVKENKITSDIVNAFAENFPEIDLNWLIKSEIQSMKVEEEASKYGETEVDELNHAIELLQKLKEKVSLK